jgi:succinate dehydrogenase / fumarate reductase cytochrome b subunit
MSIKNVINSSIIKKVWMALTGLFLCTFLVGHLAGNMQLIMKTGEEGRRAFNEYAYFMAHNPFIKALSYFTYFSIIFHAVQGFYLTYQNKKARPQGYAYSKPGANSSLPSRYMAVLGTVILVFIVTHMANFWWRAKIKEDIPLHTYMVSVPGPMGQMQQQELYYTHNMQIIPKSEEIEVKNKTELYMAKLNVKVAEGYKDLHTVVMDFFNPKKNNLALAFMLLYVISMAVLGFHLWHGFASGFQSLGFNHKRYTPLIHGLGKLFAVVVPGLFALITLMIYFK